MPTDALPGPHLRFPAIEYTTTTTVAGRQVPVDPTIRLRLFTPNGSPRFAHLTEREVIGIIEDATRVLIRLHADRAVAL